MRTHLPLIAFSDRELLHAIADNLDDRGEVNPGTVATVLDVERRAVGSRFGWLVRFGILAKSKTGYRMTAAGKSIYEAKLTASQEKVVEALVNGRGVAAIGVLMRGETDAISAKMTRREFRYWDSRR